MKASPPPAPFIQSIIMLQQSSMGSAQDSSLILANSSGLAEWLRQAPGLEQLHVRNHWVLNSIRHRLTRA